MTPLQIAHAHCANWRKDNNACLGAMIDDDFQIRRCFPKPKCVLGTPGQRYVYFEGCVLPMGRGSHDPHCRQEFEEAFRQYQFAANLPSRELRKCPTCGRGMEPRRRLCPVCAAAKRRGTYRQAKAKGRMTCPHLTQIGPLKAKGLQGHFSRVGMRTAGTAKTAVDS